MWKRLFGRQSEGTDQGVDGELIIAQLNARVQPMDRYDHYEEPLGTVLADNAAGEVTGGGTQLTDEPDGIAYCDLEIVVPEASAATIKLIIDTLEGIGAPKGSLLKFTDGRNDIPFGQNEGMAVFINGTELPDEVYETSDVNEVISKVDEAIDGIGGFQGYWEGSTETGLYFYGTSFTEMQARSAAFIASYPLCQKARIVQIA